MSASLSIGPAGALAQAEAVREHLAAFLSEGTEGPLTIDLSGVREADVSLVQLLVAAAKTAAGRGVALGFVSSPAVDALFGQAGLPGWPADPRF